MNSVYVLSVLQTLTALAVYTETTAPIGLSTENCHRRKNQIPINTNGLPEGTYLITLQTEKNTYTQKMQVVR